MAALSSVDGDGSTPELHVARSDSPASLLLDHFGSALVDHQLTTGIVNPVAETESESDTEIDGKGRRTSNGSTSMEIAAPDSKAQSDHNDWQVIYPDMDPRIKDDGHSNIDPDSGSVDKSAGLSVSPKMDFDELLSLTGEFGRFQAIVFAILSLGIFIEVMLVLGYVFVAATPPHWCTAPEELDRMNLTHEDLLRLTLPVDAETETGYSQCRMYDRNYTGWTMDDVNRWLNASLSGGGDNWTTTTCQSGWNYDHSVYASTIVSDWDLVCDDSWMASFAYTVIGLGQLIGATFWGALSDRFGRRRPYYVAMALMISSASFVCLSPNFIVYCVLQFIVAVNTVACFATGITIAVELSGVTWRGHVATAINYFWTLGYMMLAVIAYGIRDWTYLQLTISLPFVLFLLTAIFVPESPRWLYSRGRSDEADKIIRKMVNFNGQTLPDNLDVYVDTSDDPDGDTDHSSCLDLFRTSRMRINTIVLAFVWFANALVYYGVSIFMPMMAGNVYLNFFLSGAVEIPGYAVAQLSIAYLGRRWPLCGTMTIAGIALICTMVIPEDLSWLSITLTMIGKLCVTASWAIAICFTAELYPTVIRAKGMFTSTLCGNIGNALAPMVGLLSNFSPYIPLGTFGVVAVVGGLTSLIPPETKGKHLLDSIPSTDDEFISINATTAEQWKDDVAKTPSFRPEISHEMEQPTSGKYSKWDDTQAEEDVLQDIHNVQLGSTHFPQPANSSIYL